MTVLVPLALFGWIPLVVLLFACLPARWATGIAFAAGWCFLPTAGYSLPGLPDYSKITATTLGALVGISIFNFGLVSQFRFRWFDLPALIYCFCPMASSLSNGLGAYDGAAEILGHFITWGLPYLLGRIVYRSSEDLVALAVAIVGCGLVYVPLCLWEVKMSPQLHYQLYGFYQHKFSQTIRYGGWRPMVFMQHGIQVGLWIGSCAIVAFSAWRVGRVKVLYGVPLLLVVASLFVTLVLIKSMNALVLVALAVAILICVATLKSSWPLLIMPVLVLTYLAIQIQSGIMGDFAVQVIRNYISEERAESLEFRLTHERMLIEKALERPVFGWGGWGRNRIHDDQGNDISKTDGLWTLAFGINGSIGLLSLYSMLLVGPTLFILRTTRELFSGDWMQSVGIGLAAACYANAIDSLPNSMVLPVFAVAAGGLATASERITSNPGLAWFVTSESSGEEPCEQAELLDEQMLPVLDHLN